MNLCMNLFSQVEFFGAQLDGFAFTRSGWVQSYGSRCVRPPIIRGDVARRPNQAMTVREFQVAQSRTARPVKGMLTGAPRATRRVLFITLGFPLGPVTILNWSFSRKDVSRAEQAFQIAACVRAEVALLEAAGCVVVQVDEPALREGLPLKKARWDEYMKWATDAFRLATAGCVPFPLAVSWFFISFLIPRSTLPHVQLVTHLCYSSFEDILPGIDALDADCLTIENGTRAAATHSQH